MAKRRYPSDLTDRAWAVLEPLLPPSTMLVPVEVDRASARTARSDGIFCTLRGGGAWRMMPKALPPWQTAYHYFRTWRMDGPRERIHRELRDRTRLTMAREANQTAAILASPSVRTSEQGGRR